MKSVTIDFTDRQLREFSYFLKLRYGKKKRVLKNIMKFAILEVVSMQAQKEVMDAEEKL